MKILPTIKVKPQKLTERDREIMDNADLERDQKKVFKKVEGGIEHAG